MQWKQWLVWASRTVATAILLSFLCIWTTGYIVNSYMETLLKQLDLPLQTQPFALSGIWGKMWGADPVTPSASETTRPDAGTSSPSGTGHNASGSDTPSGGTDEPSPDDPAWHSPDAKAPGGDGSVPVFGSGGTGILGMTDQQRETLQSVMSKLNGEQLGALSDSLQDGLTEEELTDVGEMLKPVLTDEEYQKIMGILASRVTPAAGSSETPQKQAQSDSP